MTPDITKPDTTNNDNKPLTIQNANEDFTRNETTIENLKGDVTKLRQELEGLKNDLNVSKKDYLTILGIFVSLITFVSVEIQILKKARGALLLIGLSGIMIGGLSLFVMILTNFVNDNNKWSTLLKPLFVIPSFFFIVGAICLILIA